ncbi:hypothetical protein [Niallia endozanthoxylica]|uniref:Uncharacterized protein n=1 Tax=Niallia endozanthoxylica TaxID=2036016 RepID=A0A5J5H662_9BACI|nr:hypothetical protein [Niallia endozanthoxylica]KAA9014894.1 hypothetical protein F4V44_23115 [Niallia endozanthoxylica]
MERKIALENRYLGRSRRMATLANYYADETIKKGKKEWEKSKRYISRQPKLRDLQRKAALSRKYAPNEEVNKLRSLGNELFILF